MTKPVTYAKKLVVITKFGKVQETLLEGYEAEYMADTAFTRISEHKTTLQAFIFDVPSDGSEVSIRNSYPKVR